MSETHIFPESFMRWISLLCAAAPDIRLLSVIVANGAAMIGILGFQTSTAALLLFYWLELGVLAIWGLIRALFAGNVPKINTDQGVARVISTSTLERYSRWRENHLPIPWTDIGIYYGTIPAFMFFVPLLTAVWLGFGGFVAGPVIVATDTTETPLWVITGAIAVFILEAGQTIIEYFYTGDYQNTNAWMPVKGVLWNGFVLTLVGFFILIFAREFTEVKTVSIETAASTAIVSSILLCKFVIDLTVYYNSTRDQSLTEII